MNKQLENSSLIETKRNFGLDVMRSCAILLVLLQHGQFFIAKSETQLFYVQLFNLIDGVSIFFVLSGFLIGRILVKDFIDKEITFQSLLNFWLRRWLRTIPSYYLVLTIVMVFTVIINKQDSLWIHFQYYLFLQNLTYEISKFFPEAWSLSIEEWFYFIFPIFGFLFSFVVKFNKKNSFLFVIILFSESKNRFKAISLKIKCWSILVLQIITFFTVLLLKMMVLFTLLFFQNCLAEQQS